MVTKMLARQTDAGLQPVVLYSDPRSSASVPPDIATKNTSSAAQAGGRPDRRHRHPNNVAAIEDISSSPAAMSSRSSRASTRQHAIDRYYQQSDAICRACSRASRPKKTSKW